MIRRLALCASLCAVAAAAQQAPPLDTAVPQYDLVSVVKPNRSLDAHLRIRMNFDAIDIQNATLRDLLTNTYGLRASLILNLPKWAENDHFDIQAKVLSDDPDFLQHISRPLRRKIFERLLFEEFGVVSHQETRIAPIYELVQAGHGPQLIENPPPPPSDTPDPIKPGRNGRGNTSLVGTNIDATGIRISDLCGTLGHVLDRDVIDKTGLAGFYDITLSWSDEHSDPADGDASMAAPSLFSALKEQLGLKLVPAKWPVDVLVVDKASPPKHPN
jgi:uncharacterized protein (TIGR03435 family)